MPSYTYRGPAQFIQADPEGERVAPGGKVTLDKAVMEALTRDGHMFEGVTMPSEAQMRRHITAQELAEGVSEQPKGKER